MLRKPFVWVGLMIALLGLDTSVARAGYSITVSLVKAPTTAGDSVELALTEVGSRPSDLKVFETYLVKVGTSPKQVVGSQSAKSTKTKLSVTFRDPPGPGTYRFHVKARRQNPNTGDMIEPAAAANDTGSFTYGSASSPAKPKVDLAGPGMKLFVEVPPIGNTDRWLPQSVWALGVRTAVAILQGGKLAGVATHDVELTENGTSLTTPEAVKAALCRRKAIDFTLVAIGQGQLAASGQAYRVANANGESVTPHPGETQNIVEKGALVPIKGVDLAKARVFVEVVLGPKNDRWLAQAVWVEGCSVGPVAIRGANPVMGGKLPPGTILTVNGQQITTATGVRDALIKLAPNRLWIVEAGQGKLGAEGGNPKGGKIVVAKGEESKNIIATGELLIPLVTIDLGLGTLLARHKDTLDYVIATPAGAPLACLVQGYFVWFPLPVNVQFASKGATISREQAFALIKQNAMSEGDKSAAGLVAAGAGNAVTTGGGNLIGLDGSTLVGNDGASLAGAGNIDNVLKEATRLVAAGGGNLVAAGGGNLVAAGGGNLVAAGGGNLVAAGGGNLVAAGAGNLVAAGGGNILPSFKLVAAGGGNIIAASGGNFAVLKNYLSAYLPDLANANTKVILEAKKIGTEAIPTSVFVTGRLDQIAKVVDAGLQVTGTNPPQMRFGVERVPTVEALGRVPISRVTFVNEGLGVKAAQGQLIGYADPTYWPPTMSPGAIKGLKSDNFQQPSTLGEALRKKSLGARFEIKK